MTFLTKKLNLSSQISGLPFSEYLHTYECQYFSSATQTQKSVLHKQPFITAHFQSSLHKMCITAR